MIRVLVCDDQEIVREGMRTILAKVPEIQVVGVAAEGAGAVELVAQLRPDVVLMDLKMPGMNGIQATRVICDQYPSVHVLVLTTYDADEWVFDAIRAGAHGYVLKDTPREELVAAIKTTAAGETAVDPGIARKLFAHIAQNIPPAQTTLFDGLNEREREVLQLIARGKNNADIAEHLHLTEGTVRNYVSAILGKLGVADRTQAALLAARAGLL